MSLHSKGYFSHKSAVFFHGLTTEAQHDFFLNIEQSPKPRRRGKLAQEAIDSAFELPARISSNIAEYNGKRIYLLSGKATNNLEVIEHFGPDKDLVRVTSLERTLIDTAVRPEYAGGVSEVLKAYRTARHQLSVPKLVTILKKLDYIYPYHQSIGFYMCKAGGYDNEKLELLRQIPMEFDFYLTNEITEPCYDKSWRICFPRSLYSI
jgi:predicted transcriptional regulator of viral defense system